MTHICVSKLTIIGSDNGLSPDRRQAIILTNAGILLIGPLGTNFSEILIEILTFSFKKMRLKGSSAKRRPFCLGLNVLMRPGIHCTSWASKMEFWLCLCFTDGNIITNNVTYFMLPWTNDKQTYNLAKTPFGNSSTPFNTRILETWLMLPNTRISRKSVRDHREYEKMTNKPRLMNPRFVMKSSKSLTICHVMTYSDFAKDLRIFYIYTTTMNQTHTENSKMHA